MADTEAAQTESPDDVLKLVKIIKEKVFDRNQILLETEVQIW